ncbi:hypothetical protein EUS_19170 [[Eubacterium] siraeum 70/3]|uniref:Uncharacterized protein n=1 Tax=[Eubacterium] siraeum 70/3 TaxID=657319 RepID=D4JV57_9FIRM|nr:hypothetical protein EUS_19170 [[Eubacterium] siraeum 70/3]
MLITVFRYIKRLHRNFKGAADRVG